MILKNSDIFAKINVHKKLFQGHSIFIRYFIAFPERNALPDDVT